MAVLFGTLGWRPQSLIPSIRSTSNLEKLVFYHSGHQNSLKARDTIVEYCDRLSLSVLPVLLDNAFNFLDIAKKIKEDIRCHRKEGRYIAAFNIAGGTRLMSSAALLVCILEGIPTRYVHDETYEEIHLPLLQVEYRKALTRKQRQILQFLLQKKDVDFTETALAKALGMHKATLNHHIKELKRRGVITLERGIKDSRIALVRVPPGLELLLD